MTANELPQPQLLALLICQEILMDQANIPTLVKVVDTFVGEVAAIGKVTAEEKRLVMPLQLFVFTRWGPGEGDFVEELTLVGPNGKELFPQIKAPFTKPSGFHFQQVRHEVRLALGEAGIYSFRVYLNGVLRGEHPFKVEIKEVPWPTKQP